MAQKAITIYTPENVAPHIGAPDDAQIYRGIFGGSGITRADERLSAEIINNTTIRLHSGVFSNSGYMHIIPKGTSEDLTIASGMTGVYRRDLIVSEFARGGGSSSDTLEFKVIRGTEVNSQQDAVAPTLTKQDIGSSVGTVNQEPIYEIVINGTEIAEVIQVAENIKIGEGDVPETRKINGYPLSEDVNLVAGDIGAVPTSRTIAGKSLNNNVTLMPEDVYIIYSDTPPKNNGASYPDGTIWLVPVT